MAGHYIFKCERAFSINSRSDPAEVVIHDRASSAVENVCIDAAGLTGNLSRLRDFGAANNSVPRQSFTTLMGTRCRCRLLVSRLLAYCLHRAHRHPSTSRRVVLALRGCAGMENRLF